ncbi:MAG TPA: signal peptidase I [Thermoanaerobaculia bacterium]|nr:signal peptidase I [Thermoanaerobaculia bacterium]
MPRQKSLFRTIFEPIAVAIALALLVRAAVHLYSIPSASMAPTLQSGDQIVVTPYFFGRIPQRGDVVVFASPLDRGELIVKRVVAVPGDLIDSRLGRVRVGGYTLPEPYLLGYASTGSIPAQVIPADSYFVLGDNRGDSIDSRSWGVVPQHTIVGRARLVLWSSAPLGEPAQASDGDGRSAQRSRSRGRLFKWIE